jgi:hypothetical protein
MLRRPESRTAAHWGRPGFRSLKAQQLGRLPKEPNAGVDVIPGESPLRTARVAPSTAGTPAAVGAAAFPRKEVIQPQLPLRLPCYDFTPITDSTFGRCLPRVGARTSGVSGFRGVTGGVYKARERIHRGIADPRLLATPTSWRRVSASNPNWDRLFGIRSTSRSCSPLYRPL